MASHGRKNHDGGKRCVAGGPNGESCGNGQHTPGGSIHHFPHQEKEPDRYMHWVRFVRRHRPKWTPTSRQTILCGIHFEDSCFTVNSSIAQSLGIKTMLQPNAVPTVDAANEITGKPKQSGRERRKVRWPLLDYNNFFMFKLP